MTQSDVDLFRKAGALITKKSNQFNWMSEKTELNLLALSDHQFASSEDCFFKEITEQIKSNEATWKAWMEEDEPETKPVPHYEDKLLSYKHQGQFMRLCLIRSVREDRTIQTVN